MEGKTAGLPLKRPPRGNRRWRFIYKETCEELKVLLDFFQKIAGVERAEPFPRRSVSVLPKLSTALTLIMKRAQHQKNTQKNFFDKMRAFWVRSYLFQRRIFLDKSKLISIGTLSKLTGVHIKSLRYYGPAGHPPPGLYRPVKRLPLLLLPADPRRRRDPALRRPSASPSSSSPTLSGRTAGRSTTGRCWPGGDELAGAKIRSIQERLQFLHQIEEEFDRGAALQESGGWIEADMPEKPCRPFPTAGKLGTLGVLQGDYPPL